MYLEIEIYDELKFEIKDGKINQEFISNLENMIMPDISGHELTDIIPLIENAGCQVIIEGDGNKAKQLTKPGTKLKKGQTIKINLI